MDNFVNDHMTVGKETECGPRSINSAFAQMEHIGAATLACQLKTAQAVNISIQQYRNALVCLDSNGMVHYAYNARMAKYGI